MKEEGRVGLSWSLSLRSIMARCAHNPPQFNQPTLPFLSAQSETAHQFAHSFAWSAQLSFQSNSISFLILKEKWKRFDERKSSGVFDSFIHQSIDFIPLIFSFFQRLIPFIKWLGSFQHQKLYCYNTFYFHSINKSTDSLNFMKRKRKLFSFCLSEVKWSWIDLLACFLHWMKLFISFILRNNWLYVFIPIQFISTSLSLHFNQSTIIQSIFSLLITPFNLFFLSSTAS